MALAFLTANDDNLAFLENTALLNIVVLYSISFVSPD